jgi:predicted amidophosphoribosyltransferase
MPDVSGKAIVLIDDVITTGATASAAATALKRSGARRVDVLALAIVSNAYS